MLGNIADAIRRRLPPGWSAQLLPAKGDEGLLVLEAANGQRAELPVVSRKRFAPRDTPGLSSRALGGRLFLVAPFLGERSRELLGALGVSFADATGNIRLAIDDPAVFIEGWGADRDPDRQPRALGSLKGAVAGRVIRALCDFAPPYGIRMLAQASSTPLGTVSRVVSFLETEALLVRDENRQITSVDWAGLISRWARDYGVRKTNAAHSFLEPRGIAALPPKLGLLDRYALTGSLAGPGIAPARLAMIYVDDAAAAAVALELAPTEAGANVWLLEPYDDVVFERTRRFTSSQGTALENVVAAAPAQVAVDLMTSPGRGPQEAEALIERMKETEDDWRQQVRA
jgi:hypothetical protein